MRKEINSEKLVNVLDTFKHSINIKYDYTDLKKINSFIPTIHSIGLLNKYLKLMIQGETNSFLLSGAYGTGKSFLISILLSILSPDVNRESLSIFLEKVSTVSEERETFEDYIENNNHIVVFPNDIFNDFSQSISLGIIESKKQYGLTKKHKTSFSIILYKIQNWDENYKFFFKRFNEELSLRDIDYEEFLIQIENHSIKFHRIFEEIYPLIMGGDFFVPIGSTISINEVIKEFEEEAIANGFSGIIYVFDEFGRYLENNIQTLDVKQIQDLAEYCNSENKSSLFLVSHKDIFQYSTKVKNHELKLEWEKVSGRFLKDHLTYEESNILTIIELVLQKTQYFNDFFTKNKKIFDSIDEIINAMADIESSSSVYYPLCYTTALMLPGLSQKLAQNERTLFTFLCGDEEKSMKNVYSEGNKVKFVSPAKLYDFFEDNFKFLGLDSKEYKIYLNAKSVLTKVNNSIEIKLVKIIAIFHIFNEFSKLPPNKDLLKLSLGEDLHKFDTISKKLIEKNYIRFSRHYQQFFINQDFEVNIEKEVKEYASEQLSNFNPIETLTENLFPGYEYPITYNENYKITRYFGKYYLDISDITRIDSYILTNEIEDGKIVLITNLYNKDFNIEDLVEIYGDQAIFIYNPKQDLNILQELSEIESINRMVTTNPIFYRSEIAKSEIQKLKSELLEYIDLKISSFFNISSELTVYMNTNNLESPSRFKNQYSYLISLEKYLEEKYMKFFVVNYELINKTKLTSPIKKARKTILEKTRRNEIDNDYLLKTGAENSIARKVLKNLNLLNLENNKLDFSKTIPMLEEMYHDVIETIKFDKITFKDLYTKFSSNKSDYGLRKGLFTFLLALIIERHLDSIYISANGEEINITPDLFDRIEIKPDAFHMNFIKFTQDEFSFLDKLEERFTFNINPIIKAENKSLAVFNAFKIYIFSLPKLIFSQSLNGNGHYQKIFEGISINNSKEFFFKKLPKIYKTDDFTKIDELFNNDLDKIEENVVKIDKKIEYLIRNILILKDLPFEDALQKWNQELPNQKREDDFNTLMLNWLIVSTEKKIFDKKEFIRSLTEKVNGFDYYNWRSSEDFFNFETKLENILNELNGNDSSLLFGKTNLNINTIEYTQIGKILKNKLKADISNIGTSVSDDEVRKVLIDLLKEVE